MRKLIIISLLFICLKSQATIWYFSPTGNDDTGDGSIGNPWATWGKAFNWEAIAAGDTVYFRGGVYNKNIAEGDDDWYYPNRSQEGTGYNISRDGALGDTLYYLAYPGEVPILDCYNAYHATNRYCWGIYAGSVNYVKFKGLTVRNVRQIAGRNMACFGMQIRGGDIIVENCKFYNIWGVGLRIGANTSKNVYITNCDAYNCCDSLSTDLPGNDGYGFSVIESNGNVYFSGCRAWNCGDDGFNAGILESQYSAQYIEYNGCWAFSNGMLEGGGYGFKMGWFSYTDGNLKRTYTNCIAAYNRWGGWTTNDRWSWAPHAAYCNVFNNIAYHNGYSGLSLCYGFMINNTYDSDANELKRTLKNNISYANEDGAIGGAIGYLYTHETNSWDNPPGVTITDADFLSLDSTGITAARQADGSLPDNDCYNKFLRLSSTSLAYQAGVDVGLTYDAVDSLWRDPPSIGAYEYYSQETPEEPAVLSEVTTSRPRWQTSTTAISGGNVFDDGGGTVSARGVCWSTSQNPTISDSHTTNGTGTGVFYSEMTGLNQNWVYYVRAYATNEVGTAYGNQMIFAEGQVLGKDNVPMVLLKDGVYYIFIKQ